MTPADFRYMNSSIIFTKNSKTKIVLISILFIFRQKIDTHWKDTFKEDILNAVIFIVIFAQNLSRLLANSRLVLVWLLSFYSRGSKLFNFGQKSN